MSENKIPRYIELNNKIMIKDKDGKYQLDKDKEAAKSFFVDFVNDKTKFFHTLEERMEFLVENDYYDKKVLEQYPFDFIQKIRDYVYSFKFRFPSFMAAFKFYDTYALRDRKGEIFLERYEDRVYMIALYLAKGNQEKAMNFAKAMITQQYQPATPTFLNAGLSRGGEMVSCFLLEVGDSMNDIAHALGNSLHLSKIGGGVALNLDNLRAKGDPIKGEENKCSGIVPVMKLLENCFSYANQGGKRDGSGAVYLSVMNIGINDFLSTKKINADENSRIQTLSLGVKIPDIFMEHAEKGKDVYVFSPYYIKQEYGIDLDEVDWSEMYDELVENPRLRKQRVNPRDILVEIAKIQQESGYPYIMFTDNCNKRHALKSIGKIRMSNLCSEILQLSEVSEINDYDQEDIIRRAISCNLGSLNIYQAMKHKTLEETISAAMDMLTAVSDMTKIGNVPSVAKANEEFHSVGLGDMNLQGYLISEGIAYESKTARDFARTYYMTKNYYTIKRSMQIAAEREETFKDFEKSTYATGEYFDMYLEEDFSPVTKKAKKLFEGIYIPTIEDWKWLASAVKEYGMYHAYRQAIAPTGSISYVQSATPSVLPAVSVVEERETGKASTIYPMPFFDESTEWLYTNAYDMNDYDMLDMIATIQPHVDQGISTTLHVKSNYTTRDIAQRYIYAWKKGLKTLYYTRTQKLNEAEVDAALCAGCVI